MISRRALIAASAFAVTPAFAQTAEPTGQPPLPPALMGLAAKRVLRADGSVSMLGTEVPMGKAAIVSFWAAWCAPCVAEARHLSELRMRYPAEQLTIVGVNVDRARDPERMQQFRRRARVNYAQLLGDLELYQAFNLNTDTVVRLPRCYVFARDGTPLAAFGRYFGDATLSQIDDAVVRALA